MTQQLMPPRTYARNSREHEQYEHMYAHSKDLIALKKHFSLFLFTFKLSKKYVPVYIVYLDFKLYKHKTLVLVKIT